jgi:hypothetical protein
MVAKAATEPETISTPRPAMPPSEPAAESTEELPELDNSKLPETTPEPGPREEEPDMAPQPPTGSEPAVPPGVNEESGKPSQDLDDLFPDENATPKDESKGDTMDEPKDQSDETPNEAPGDSPDDAKPEADGAAPDGASGDAMPQSRRGGGRRTSFNSASTETKMHWRRSSRLAPAELPETHGSGDDGRATAVGRSAAPSSRQEGASVALAVGSSSNPLRGTRSLPPHSASQSESLAETGAVPAVADWSAAASRANPLRGGQ